MIDILPVHLIMDVSNTDNLIYDTTQQVLVIYYLHDPYDVTC